MPALTVRLLKVALAAMAAEDAKTKINAVMKNSNLFTIVNFVTAIASYNELTVYINYVLISS